MRELECLWQLPGNTLLPYIRLYLYYLIHLSTDLSQGSPWSEAGICSHWGLLAFPKSAGNKRVLLKRAQNSRAFWEALLGWLSAPPASALHHCVHFATLFLYKYLSQSLPFQHPAKQAGISWKDGLHRLLAKNIRQWDATVILKAFLCLKRIEFIPLSIKTRQLKIQQGLDLLFQIKGKKVFNYSFLGREIPPRSTSPFKEKKT